MSTPRMTSATFAVLKTLLKDEECYGLELMRKTGLPSGTVYPILARLEDARWVVSRWENSAARGPRKRLYQLTPTGVREALGAEAGLAPAARVMANILRHGATS
ncbi:MAG: PadR family transcriptional regulator [Actinomycetota bacterium]|jgi:DNA-binding PadR family transcriptional regulator|nr:PadR family transcriptional regulator [Actinomycetota bacterium]